MLHQPNNSCSKYLLAKIACFLTIPLLTVAFSAPAQADLIVCGFYTKTGKLVMPVENRVVTGVYLNGGDEHRIMMKNLCLSYLWNVVDSKTPLSPFKCLIGSTNVTGYYAWRGTLYPVGYEETVVYKPATNSNQLKCRLLGGGRCDWYNSGAESSPASCNFKEGKRIRYKLDLNTEN